MTSTRRSFTAATAGLVAVPLLGGATVVDAESNGEDDLEALSTFGGIGVIAGVSADALQVLFADQERTVRAAAGIQGFAGAFGRVSDFDQFLGGDRVFVNGALSGDGSIVASGIGSVLTPVRVTVSLVAKRGFVNTELGELAIDGVLPDQAESPPVADGDVVDGLLWTNPVTGVKYLLRPTPQ